MPSHTASGPTGCASNAILSTAVPTQTARTSLPRRRKAATGKELRPSLTQSWPCTAGGDAIRMHMQRMHRCVHGPSNPFHASRCLPSQVSWTQVCPLSTGVSSGAARSAVASVLSFSNCFNLRCFWLPARCCRAERSCLSVRRMQGVEGLASPMQPSNCFHESPSLLFAHIRHQRLAALSDARNLPCTSLQAPSACCARCSWPGHAVYSSLCSSGRLQLLLGSWMQLGASGRARALRYPM